MADAGASLDEVIALRQLVQHSTDLLSRHAPDGTYLYVSPASRRLLGYAPHELVGRSAFAFYHPEDITKVSGSHQAVLASPGARTVDCRVRHADGHYVWFETAIHSIADPETGEVLEIQASSRDVTARKAAQARQREYEERFRLAMENAPIGMALVGLEGSWIEVNARLCQILGRSEGALLGLTFQDVTHPDDLDADLAHVRELLTGDIDRYAMEKRYIHGDGHVVWVLLSVSLVRDEHGEPLYFIAQIEDITARKQQERELDEARQRLERLALYDDLTGLPNRRLMTDLLERTLARARREDTAVAVMFLDLDGFKRVNDTYGHAAGDTVLREAATRFRSVVRESDAIGRYGGDEFIVTTAVADPRPDAERLARRLAVVMHAPVAIDDTTVHVGTSVGVAIGDGASTPDLLLRTADAELYRVKSDPARQIAIRHLRDTARP